MSEKDLLAAIGRMMHEQTERIEKSIDEKLSKQKEELTRVFDEKLLKQKEELTRTFDARIRCLEESFDEKLLKQKEELTRVFDEKLRDAENLVLEEVDRVQEKSNMRFQKLEMSVEELKEYYRIRRLEDNDSSLIMAMLLELKADVDELKEKIA